MHTPPIPRLFTCRWQYRLLFRDLYSADKKQDRNALAKPLQSILQEVEGSPVVKTKVLHLFRYLLARPSRLMFSSEDEEVVLTAETVESYCWQVGALAVSCSAYGVGSQRQP